MKKFKSMGVVNITPNSFSDGDQFNTSISCQEQIQKLINQNLDVVDIGAESTAPFNDPIGVSEEIRRFDNIFFPALKNIEMNEKLTFSIDTYRPEVFKQVFDKLVTILPSQNIIWNDVSGVCDPETLNVLKEVKCRYILSHTFVPEKSQTSSHMDYVQEECDIRTEVSQFFNENIKKLTTVIAHDQIILDPCFGFSKTKKQNYELIKHFPDLNSEFELNAMVFGISRKSFLKKLTQNNSIINLECIHALILNNLLERIKDPSQLLIRLHDKDVLESIYQSHKLI